jgi:uncharacterized protein (DUF1501 family)
MAMTKRDTSGLKRRDFLRNATLAALGSSTFSALSTQFNIAQAQVGGVNDYRALVCVFLYGGNDAFNMLVPHSLTEHSRYAETRRGLAIAREDLLPLSPLNSMPADYGLHPEMGDLKTLFDDEKLSFIGNVGTLIEPTLQSDYVNKRVELPPQLFSHNDQQNFVMSLQSNRNRQGWASRIADLMLDANGNQSLSMNITLSGSNTLQTGGLQAPYAIGSGGVNDYWSLQPGNPEEWAVRRNAAYDAILAQSQPHLFAAEFARTQRRSIDLGIDLRQALQAVSAPQTSFNTASRLASMLRMVSHLIAARDVLGMSRQIFFVGIGDYDTHGDQVNRHPVLMNELNHALTSFYNATVELGVSDKVTTFTASDFGRTLTSNGDGTDHGWGSHQMVMGDGVRGGEIFGTMPELVIGSNDDIGEGRIIPTTSVDQYAATLAHWFGLTPAQVTETFPTLANFNTADLGFMKSA